jgi:predicted nuclease of predicted toxin-antitoxin system
LLFFADENISNELIEWLKQQQYKISSIKAEKLFGASDKTIIDKCFMEKLIIITHDNDFGKIIFTENVSFHINNLFATWAF